MLVETECGYCEKPISREVPPSRARRRKGTKYFCNGSCAGKARWQGHLAANRQSVRIPRDHPLGVGRDEVARGNPRVAIHRVVLFEAIGEGPHPCHWCSRPIDWLRMGKGPGCHAGALVPDHIDGDFRNNTIANLVPACNECNVLRGQIAAWRRRTGREINELALQEIR